MSADVRGLGSANGLEQAGRLLGEKAAQLRESQRRVAEGSFSAEDRRKAARVTVTGTGVVSAIEVNADWRRTTQSQDLGRRILEALRAAREAASEAERRQLEEAGFDTLLRRLHSCEDESDESASPVSRVIDLVRPILPPESRATLDELQRETVHATAASGAVEVITSFGGAVESLTISSRFASQSEPAAIGAAVIEAIDAARSEWARRLEELQTTRGRTKEPLEERLRVLADRMKERFEALYTEREGR